MKYFFLFLLALYVFAEETQSTDAIDGELMFKLNLTDGLSQFKAFQDKHYAKVVQDSLTNEDVIAFDELSHYYGIITPVAEDEWFKTIDQMLKITFWFRGDNGKRTGGFIGYIRKDRNNVVIPLALDADQFMDYQQQQYLDTEDGTWQYYEFWVYQGEGIKIILEQGDYFGLETKYYCAFKDLQVKGLKLGTDCPGTAAEKLIKSFYFGKIFSDKNFKGRTNCDFVDHGETAEIRFIYPYYQAPCVITALYALDQDKKVVDQFVPKLYEVKEQQRIFTYNFTLSELNDFNCKVEDIECEGTKECELYTCPVEMYYYLDYEKEFATRQLEYDWVSQNSYAKFISFFTVQVNKQTETIFNSLIQTYVNNQVCGGKCVLDMKLSLLLKYKRTKDGEYALPGSTALSVIWGEVMYFEITSDPSDYQLTLKNIFIQTGEQQVQDPQLYTKLGEIFIDSFITNIQKSNGKITFEMKASGEAGLEKGKPFNLKFLVHSDASRLLEETYGETTANLPKAQVSGDLTIKVEGDAEVDGNTEKNAFNLVCSIIFLLGLLFVF